MKERPILMSAPMVRSTVDESKTQTRRPYKIRKHPDTGCEIAASELVREPQHVIDRICPYGQPGDRLWVRENGWERPERTPQMMRAGADTWAPYYYDADPWSEQDHADFKAWGFKRRPSIHMPRWASRILLEVTGVRVEHLKKISERDACAEGVTIEDRHMNGYCAGEFYPPSIRAYRELWEQINGAGSWDANPWVWVIEFKRVGTGAMKQAA